jgi:hypothetical protein
MVSLEEKKRSPQGYFTVQMKMVVYLWMGGWCPAIPAGREAWLAFPRPAAVAPPPLACAAPGLPHTAPPQIPPAIFTINSTPMTRCRKEHFPLLYFTTISCHCAQAKASLQYLKTTTTLTLMMVMMIIIENTIQDETILSFHFIQFNLI